MNLKVTRVYKFLSAELALWDLRNRKIKISTFSDMNDPFELLGGHCSDPQVIEDRRAIESRLNEWCGVLCFSRDWRNAMLWSHYGDKHKGICLGLDVSASLELSEPNYVGRRPDFDADLEALRTFASQGESLNPSQADSARECVTRILLTKFDAWRYEDEVRTFVVTGAEQKQGALYFAELDKDIQPRTIIMGPRCSTPTSEIRAAICGYSPPVTVVRTGLSPYSFEVIKSD